MATLTIDLKTGDVETPYNLLTYKLYGSANGYATPIATFGSADADPDVSVAGQIATIINVSLGSETGFKVGIVDQAGNESDLSDVYTYTPSVVNLMPAPSAAHPTDEDDSVNGFVQENSTTRTTDPDVPIGGGIYSVKIAASTAGTNRRSLLNFPVESGKTYRLNYWGRKGQPLEGACIQANVGEGWTATTTVLLTETWAEYTFDAVCNLTGTARVRFMVNQSATTAQVGDYILTDLITITEVV